MEYVGHLFTDENMFIRYSISSTESQIENKLGGHNVFAKEFQYPTRVGILGLTGALVWK